MRLAAGALLAALAPVGATRAPDMSADEVTALPGWSGPLPSRCWSGFLDGTPPGEQTPIHTHYWLLESENDPEKDPLIVWTNGGPGASSMFGLLVELGPLYLSEASLHTREFNESGVPTLFRNPWAWTRLGSVLIYNAPAPVGYSYCGDRPSGDAYSCGPWNDTRAALSAHAFLRSFFKAFPDFDGREMFLTGESYAGIYVPTLARELLKHPHARGPKLAGFAVGDGCVGTDVLCGDSHGPLFLVEFLHGHGQFSEALWEEIVRVCPREQLRDGVRDEACARALDRMDEEAGGYFAYALYDDCTYQNGLLRRERQPPRRASWRDAGRALSTRHAQRARLGAAARGALNDYPCGGGPAMDVWVNQTAVRRALHVPLDSRFFSFDNADGFDYTSTERSLLPFYARVARETGLRVLVYNGDTDPAINSLAAQNWTRAIGLRESARWRPWTLDGRQRMGGYVMEYEGGLTFLTIRGAGHMVPEYKPAASLEFLGRWIRNEKPRPFVKPRAAS